MKSKLKYPLAVLSLAALGGCILADGSPSALHEDQAEQEIITILEISPGRMVLPQHFLEMGPESRAHFSRDKRLRLLRMLTPEERSALTPEQLALFIEGDKKEQRN